MFTRASDMDGRFHFDANNPDHLKIKPKRGRVLIWYDMHPYTEKTDMPTLHGGLPVSKGMKMAATIFIRNCTRTETESAEMANQKQASEYAQPGKEDEDIDASDAESEITSDTASSAVEDPVKLEQAEDNTVMDEAVNKNGALTTETAQVVNDNTKDLGEESSTTNSKNAESKLVKEDL